MNKTNLTDSVINIRLTDIYGAYLKWWVDFTCAVTLLFQEVFKKKANEFVFYFK